MFDISGFEAGSAAVALTGAALGWSLRPIFLRYRRAFVVAAAVLAAAGAAAYDALEERASPVTTPTAVAHQVPPRVTQATPLSASPAPSMEAWADYLERAGRTAFAEGDYDAASRYWRDASRISPRHAAELTDAIERAQRLASERL